MVYSVERSCGDDGAMVRYWLYFVHGPFAMWAGASLILEAT